MYRIGEVAGLLNLTTQTLRFYETEGLITPPKRSEKGYRLYSEENLRQLRFILRGKQAGLSHHELQELLDIRLHSDSVPCQDVREIIKAKLTKVREQIATLQTFESSLEHLYQNCSGEGLAKDCTILGALDDLLD